MSGMDAQRQPNGATGVAVQLVYPHALLRGVAKKRLANGVRCASVVGMNSPAATQTRRGHYCLAWLCEPADRFARSLGSSGGGRKECFGVAEGFSGELRLGDWVTRSASLACVCLWFVGGLISDLRERAFLRFIRGSALVFSSAFGGGGSVPDVGCLMSAESGGENISFRLGSENFVGSNFISNILMR